LLAFTTLKLETRFRKRSIEDIAYLACDRQETDGLFSLLAARYEMRSLVITSNLAFGQWHQIFKDEMTTQAAIDRLVHHAIILELNGESYRMKQARANNGITPLSSFSKDGNSEQAK
jgi:hypothetical protein